jgi:hypothetical protein
LQELLALSKMKHKFAGNKCTFCGVSIAVSGYSEECPARPTQSPTSVKRTYSREEYGNPDFETPAYIPPVRATPASMASNPSLISCPDCGQKVSKNAAACPGCGAPISAAARSAALTAALNEKFGIRGPKCPICGCVALSRITTIDRVAMGFIPSAGKSLKCGACGALS